MISGACSLPTDVTLQQYMGTCERKQSLNNEYSQCTCPTMYCCTYCTPAKYNSALRFHIISSQDKGLNSQSNLLQGCVRYIKCYPTGILLWLHHSAILLVSSYNTLQLHFFLYGHWISGSECNVKWLLAGTSPHIITHFFRSHKFTFFFSFFLHCHHCNNLVAVVTEEKKEEERNSIMTAKVLIWWL